MKKYLKRITSSSSSVRNLPKSPGVYTFWQNNTPIYIGKAVNLKSRVSSYFSKAVFGKTKNMVNASTHISYIQVVSELEALLLEALMVKKHLPKYNVLLRDDKHPLYIRITNEEFPRIITARKIEEKEKNIAFYGPFPSSFQVKKVLKTLRQIFPFSTHKLSQRACLDNQIGLCNPCPNTIYTLSGDEHDAEKVRYLYNIKNIKKILSGNIAKLKSELLKDIVKLSRTEEYESAKQLKEKLFSLEYITQPISDVGEFISNPNMVEDIRRRELTQLKTILKEHLNVTSLKRIECYDIAHISGEHTTGSMVVFLNAEKRESEYRHFKIVSKRKASDTDYLRELIRRRIKHFNDWGIPDLVVVDGGKPQTSTFSTVLSTYSIPCIGIAKREETLILPVIENDNIKFIEKRLFRSEAKNLIQRMRDESHRFARRYLHNLMKRSLLNNT